jgi:predicted membrane protein
LKPYKLKKMKNNNTITKYLVIVLATVGGLGLLGKLQERTEQKTADGNSSPEKQYFESKALMGASNKSYAFSNLKGGEIMGLMSGTKIDLSKAKIDNHATIDVLLMMGGVKLIVPKDWQVVLNATCIMGDAKDKGTRVSTLPNKTLEIDGLVLMGGIDIERI